MDFALFLKSVVLNIKFYLAEAAPTPSLFLLIRKMRSFVAFYDLSDYGLSKSLLRMTLNTWSGVGAWTAGVVGRNCRGVCSVHRPSTLMSFWGAQRRRISFCKVKGTHYWQTRSFVAFYDLSDYGLSESLLRMTLNTWSGVGARPAGVVWRNCRGVCIVHRPSTLMSFWWPKGGRISFFK